MKTMHKPNKAIPKVPGTLGYTQGTWYLGLMVLFIFTLCAIPASPLLGGRSSEPEDQTSDYLVFKMMVVNPSSKHSQTYPMKAYLPEEVRPEHIMDSADLRIELDPERQAYYVTQELELTPGQALVKSIKIRDIWVVPPQKIEQYTEETNNLYGKLRSTEQEKHARMLLSNVETLALQIEQSQKNDSLTPNEHIALYQSNKKKLRDMQMDMLMLRRMVINAGGDVSGLLPLDGEPEIASLTSFARNDAMASSLRGPEGPEAIPARIASLTSLTRNDAMTKYLRLIFAALAFLGAGCLLYFGFWQHKGRAHKPTADHPDEHPRHPHHPLHHKAA